MRERNKKRQKRKTEREEMHGSGMTRERKSYQKGDAFTKNEIKKET